MTIPYSYQVQQHQVAVIAYNTYQALIDDHCCYYCDISAQYSLYHLTLDTAVYWSSCDSCLSTMSTHRLAYYLFTHFFPPSPSQVMVLRLYYLRHYFSPSLFYCCCNYVAINKWWWYMYAHLQKAFHQKALLRRDMQKTYQVRKCPKHDHFILMFMGGSYLLSPLPYG